LPATHQLVQKGVRGSVAQGVFPSSSPAGNPMALPALKQLFGYGSQYGKPNGIENGQCNGFQHGTQHGVHAGPAVGNRLTPCPPGYRPAPSAYEYAVYFLKWLNEKFPPPPRELWVAARDLEHVLFPQFLAATERPTLSWRTVADHLRKLTDWRQKDCRQGPDRRGPSLVEYMVRGPRKKR
jgi:hypothetical protein